MSSPPSKTSSPLPYRASPLLRQTSPSPSSPSSPAVDDESIPEAPALQIQSSDLPMTMTGSIILTKVPGESKKALETFASSSVPEKDAPALKQTRFKIPSSQPFGAVMASLRKKLKMKEGASLCCYIDNFSPAPDEGIGGLYNCFKKGDELKVGYSLTPTFG